MPDAFITTVPEKSLKVKHFSLKELVKTELTTSLKEIIEAQVNASLKDVRETNINIALKALIETELHTSLKRLINAKVKTSLKEVVKAKVKTSLKEVAGREFDTSLEGRTYKLIEEEVKTSLCLKEHIEKEIKTSMKEVIDAEVSTSTKGLIETEIPKCQEFVSTLLELQKLLEIFTVLTMELRKDAEKETMKEWQGSRKLLKSIAEQREAQKQELIVLIDERKTDLERLLEDHAPIQ